MIKSTSGKALVKYVHWNAETNEEEYIGSYWTNEPDKALRFFKFAMDNETDVSFNEHSSEIAEHWKNDTCLVDDITISLETDTDIMVINVWIV